MSDAESQTELDEDAPPIEVKGLVSAFGDHIIHDGLDLTVRRGEVLGVVVGMAESSELPSDPLLQPLRALELGVPGDLVALAAWLAREYCSTPARALALMMAPGALVYL